MERGSDWYKHGVTSLSPSQFAALFEKANYEMGFPVIGSVNCYVLRKELLSCCLSYFSLVLSYKIVLSRFVKVN